MKYKLSTVLFVAAIILGLGSLLFVALGKNGTVLADCSVIFTLSGLFVRDRENINNIK